tara:strand:+ start:332 stop:526 length:195 start_codon:yes stop_codon:yes gene_type:complete
MTALTEKRPGQILWLLTSPKRVENAIARGYEIADKQDRTDYTNFKRIKEYQNYLKVVSLLENEE